jgi:hypothetical protein
MATLDPDLVALCPDVDAAAVKEIFDTDMTDAQLNNFINAAYYMTLPLSGKLGECGGTSMQCELIKWLAAHLASSYEVQTKSESVAGEWSFTRFGKDGLGLDSSLYGQNVLRMDCSGTLAKLGLKRAQFRVISYYESAESRGYIDTELL